MPRDERAKKPTGRALGPGEGERRDLLGRRPSGSRGPRPSGPGGDRPVENRPSTDMIYGRQAVAEVLRGRRKVRRVLLAEGIKEDGRIAEILQSADRLSVPMERVERLELDMRLGDVNHQGVAAFANPYVYVPLEDLLAEQGTILVLDHLQDPQNFGTLIRAADAAGARGVVIAQDRSVSVTSSVVNASAGAVEHLLVAQTPNLIRAIEAMKAAGWWTIGLDTGDDAVDLFTGALPTPAALIVGAEGAGISALVRKSCDVIAAIPMRGQVASLNAATAGSIALFELVRRERTTGHA